MLHRRFEWCAAEGVTMIMLNLKLCGFLHVSEL